MTNSVEVINISNVDSVLHSISVIGENYEVYNSNMMLDYSITADKKDFEPITAIYPIRNIANYSWNTNQTPIGIEEFREQLLKCNKDYGIEREIEDGFVYAEYETLIIRDDLKIIVLL